MCIDPFDIAFGCGHVKCILCPLVVGLELTSQRPLAHALPDALGSGLNLERVTFSVRHLVSTAPEKGHERAGVQCRLCGKQNQTAVVDTISRLQRVAQPADLLKNHE